ncbi:MAG: peptidase S9 [Rhodothermaceae bacterium]|nr:MAG: peptidase S9 [Rhodothermaceae bacterium]
MRFPVILLAFLLPALVCVIQATAQPVPLTVEQIMQDPASWVGDSPSSPWWSEDGTTLYFWWNPQGQFPADSLYRVTREGNTPEQVPPDERRRVLRDPRFDGWHHGEHVYDTAFRRKVYEHDGDLFLYDRQRRTRTRLTDTREQESDPRFTPDGTGVVFVRDDNLFLLDLATGALRQLTDLRKGKAPKDADPDAQDAFLRAQQLHLFDYLRKQKEEREAREKARERDRRADDPPPTFYLGDRNLSQLRLDPTGRFVTFVLSDEAPRKPTLVQNYVTESGYAEDLTARAKVGVPGARAELYVQDLARDTTYAVDLYQLPGAYDVVPAHRRDEGVQPDSSKKERLLYAYGPYWSGDGRYAVVEVRTRDNKDRWIARLDPETATLAVLDRQTDEAWIAGPGISWFGGRSTLGWLPDNRRFFFQSERTGYSHLYTVDVATGEVRQLTDGPFEVFDPMLSRDGRTWFFTSSEGSPFERHFYRMPVDGGPRTRLTTMEGFNEVALAPDERRMANRYSFTNRPPDLFFQTPGDAPRRLTHSPTEAWAAYPWRTGEIIRFEASDGAAVPAQLFVPEAPNGGAVLFVHGAGYLQNVHKGWSSYFREYMFHNLLVERGYYVMNVDYRASAGYGRDWRTAIYRHMGGRDLQDYVDAARYLGQAYGIPPERVFIYGGSYGGFITLMALFTEPEHFGGGAALRAVTDWAHYNHTYTSNILNTPVEDSLAYARSSPIYFAEGLEDPLLIAHGMVDTNVQFQDVVRLAQRLIELGKEGWEMAVYPVENHGFTEPASWTDEYRRILKYIEATVGPRSGVPVPAGE